MQIWLFSIQLRMTSFNKDSMSSIRFLSWNVKGPVKRTRIFLQLKRLNPDVVFLQETHLRVSDHSRLRSNWVNQYFHSNFNSRSRGVAILINKRRNLVILDVKVDTYGRYVIVTGTIYQTPVILVNIYAPNWDDPDFANNFHLSHI